MSRFIDADAFIADTKKRYCEDCEHRKGTKNGKYQFIYEIGGVRCRSCDISDMIDAVDDYYPTADVAPVVHGHYKKQYLEESERYDLECSECGFRIVLDYYDIQYAQYCNSCGAKMDEEVNNNGE